MSAQSIFMTLSNNLRDTEEAFWLHRKLSSKLELTPSERARIREIIRIGLI